MSKTNLHPARLVWGMAFIAAGLFSQWPINLIGIVIGIILVVFGFMGQIGMKDWRD